MKKSDPSSALVHLQAISGDSQSLKLKSLEIEAKCYTLLECLSGAIKPIFKRILLDGQNPITWIRGAKVLMDNKQFRRAEPFLLHALKLAEQSKDIITVFECRKLLQENRKGELIKQGGDEDIAEISARLFTNMDRAVKEGLSGINFKNKYTRDENVTGFKFSDSHRKEKLKQMIRDYHAYVTKRKNNNPDKRLMNYY